MVDVQTARRSELADQSGTVRAMIFHIWSLPNDQLHHKGVPPLEIIKDLLCSYLPSFDQIQKYNIYLIKGKMPLVEKSTTTSPVAIHPSTWPRPPLGWVALSADGSFVKETGLAESGMILRDS